MFMTLLIIIIQCEAEQEQINTNLPIKQVLRLTENEQYYIPQNSFFLPINSLENLNNTINFTNDLPLISEQLKFSTNKSFFNIFTFVSDNSEYIDICACNATTFICEYRVLNYIIDEKIIVYKFGVNSVSLNQSGCETLHKIRDGIFILQCSKIEGQVIVMIMDWNSTLFDYVELTIDKKCIPVSLLFLESFIVYEVNCFSTKIQFLSLNLRSLTFSPIIEEFEIDSSTFNLTDQSQGKLKEITFCSLNIIQLNYENYLINFILTEQLFSVINHQGQFILNKYCQRIITSANIGSFNSEQEKLSYLSLRANIYEHDILILLVDQKILAIKSQFQNQTIEFETIQIRELLKLSFFVSLLLNGDIVFYKINQQGHYLQFMNSTYIAAFPIENIQIFTQPIIYETSFYDIQTPNIILSSYSINISNQQNFSQVTLDIKSLQLSAPIDVKLFNFDQGIIKDIQKNLQILSCYISIGMLKSVNLQLLLVNINEFGLIYFNYNQEDIFIQNCKNNQTIQLPKRLCEGVKGIFVSTSVSNFAIQTNSQLRLLKVTEKFDIQLNNTIFFSFNISSIKQEKNQLLIFFVNCTSTLLSLVNFRFHFNLQYQFENCTQRTAFINNYLLLIENTLALQSFLIQQYQYQTRTQKNIIVCIQINRHKLLVLQQQQHRKKSISSKFQLNAVLYSELLQQLYELPTYDYELIYPTKFQIYQIYFIIVGINSDQKEALLFYNLNNLAHNSLLQVIQIDKGAYHFNFLDDSLQSRIFYIFNKTIRIYDFSSVTFNLVSNLIEDSFHLSFPVSLNISSQISNESKLGEMKILFVNQNQQLRFLKNISNKQITFNNEGVINLKYIFGSIHNISVRDNSKVILLSPIQQYNLTYVCSFSSQQFCFFQENLIYDYFGVKQIYNIGRQLQNIEKIEVNIDGAIYIYYLDEQFQNLQVMKYNVTQQKLIKNDLIWNIESKIKLISISGNILFLSNSGGKTLAYFNRELNQITEISYIYYDAYGLQIIELNDLAFLFLQVEKLQDLIISKQLFDPSTVIFDTLFSFTININRQEQFDKFKIFSLKRTEEKITIEVLLLHTSGTYGYIYQISIDHNVSKLLDHKIVNYIRFGDNNNQFDEAYIIEKEFMIISATNIQHSKVILFYDILSRVEQYIIDPIYINPQNNIDSIEKYNSTHFISVSYDNIGQKLLNLLSINNYRLICPSTCENQYQLLLKNQVSSLLIFAVQEQKPNLSNVLIIFLVLITFILINAQLRFQKKYRSQKHNIMIN